MKKLYTLINYIPGEEGWYDRCGDRQGGRESELNMSYYTEDEKDDLARDYGYAKFNNPDGEIKLLINGHNADEPHDSLTKEEQDELESETYHIQALADEHYDKLKAAKEKREAEEKQKKLQEQEEQRLREQRRKEDAEKAELARLMSKYGKQ
jgi:hypothetical protein